MYAFWEYDLFPYVLHGEVVNGPNEHGRVQVKGYATPHADGKGYGGGWFTPIHLVSLEAGLELGKKLDELRARHRAEVNELRKRFELELVSTMPSKAIRSLEHVAFSDGVLDGAR